MRNVHLRIRAFFSSQKELFENNIRQFICKCQ